MSRDHFWRSISRDTSLEVSAFFPSPLRSYLCFLSLQETFEIFTKSVRIDKRPRIICFYSSSNTASYKILHALGRSVLYLSKEQNAVEFGLVDLALTENSKSKLKL